MTFLHFRFRIDNTDHIIDVNVGRSMVEYDQIDIICPIYEKTKANMDNVTNLEQYIIYAVNKEEYDMCRIMTVYPRRMAQCDSPFSRRFFTISFRYAAWN